jgi:P27 family predicted phage terminase small subunit
MKRGKRPKPTHLKLLEGEKNKDRINLNEPKPKILAPKCPKHLSKEAREFWKVEAPKLKRLGLLTEIDETAFELLCWAYGKWVKAERILANEGEFIETPTGKLRLHPALNVANRALDQTRKLLAEFGMTPSSRTGISVQETGRDGGIEDLID